MMVDIGGIEPIKPVDDLGPVSAAQILNAAFGDFHQSLSAKLEDAVSAFLVSKQVDAELDEDNDDLDTGANDIEPDADPGRQDPDPTPSRLPDVARAESLGDLAQRVATTIQGCGDDLVRRASDLNALGRDSMNALVQCLCNDQAVDAVVEAERQRLGMAADEARAAFSRMADEIKVQAPGSGALVDCINANQQTIDIAAAEVAVVEQLGYAAGTTIDQLAARGLDTELGPDERRIAAFDAKLATVMMQAEFEQQLTAAREYVAGEIEQINPASRAAKLAETLLRIGEFDRLSDVNAPAAEVRTALADYFLGVAEAKENISLARDVVTRLLDYANQPADPDPGRPSGGQILEFLVQQARDGSFKPWVADAMSDDLAVRAKAEQRILAGLAGAEEPAARRDGRVSPLADIPVELQGPGTAAFDLKVKEAFDAVKSALLGLSNLGELIEHHAEGRLANVYTTLDQISGLKDAGLLGKDEPVSVGGAYFQIGKGSRVELTEAAHEAPGQVYVGIDETQLSHLSVEERAPYRLDSRITDEQDLASLARMQAAATNVVPGFVNEVDSLWETKGFCDALQKAVDYLVKQDANNLLAVERAYDLFHREASDALQRAQEHLLKEASPPADADAVQAQTAQEIKRRDKLAVIEGYQKVLERIDADRARELMYDWIEQTERFAKGPQA